MDGQLLMISGLNDAASDILSSFPAAKTDQEKKDFPTLAKLLEKRLNGVPLSANEQASLAVLVATHLSRFSKLQQDALRKALFTKKSFLAENWKKLAVLGIGAYVGWRFIRKS